VFEELRAVNVGGAFHDDVRDLDVAFRQAKRAAKLLGCDPYPKHEILDVQHRLLFSVAQGR
jgi:hypothetical protein